ncbi:MAG: response regulator transcription factor [Pseudomonadota bacterium]
MNDVFVLEDDDLTRERLVEKITQTGQFQVSCAVASLAAAQRELAAQQPDVMLFDLQLPDGEAFDLIADYTHHHPETPILVISVFGDEQRVVRAISAGARGYLLKDDSTTQIESALSAVLAGQSPISPAIASHLVRHFRNEAAPAAAENPLSERELEVLQLAAKGMSYKEVAALLDVSVSTVGTYTMRIYTKLAVNSRAEALYEARKLGIMDD